VSGTIEAIEVDLAAEVNGVLVERPLSAGHPVQKGALVGRIDPALYRIRVEQAEAAVQQARAELALAVHGFREEEILAAAQQVSELEAETQNVQANLKRVGQLFQEKIVSEQDVDQARRLILTRVTAEEYAQVIDILQRMAAGLETAAA